MMEGGKNVVQWHCDNRIIIVLGAGVKKRTISIVARVSEAGVIMAVIIYY